MKCKKQFLTLLLLSFGLLGANAQDVVLSSGGDASGVGGSSSYSVGQIMYKSFSTPMGSLNDGVQQPYEIYTVSIYNDLEGISLSFFAYPNPTSSILNLKVENYSGNDISYQLTDLFGKQLSNGKTTGTLTKVSMEAYASSTYFLIIQKNKVNLKTFKIVKH